AIDEIVTVGRAMSASQELINERLSDANVIDTLGAETISRLGDSTVGAVLRRLPGLTLVNDKFVYIRGLGERYSQSLLNGANIPSPDLTRNVIPLDIFPTSIVESLRVQKAWSPNLPANFGGGNVDIRTRGIPDGFLFDIEVGTGYNDLNSEKGLTYPGGSDDNLGTDDGTRALSGDLLSRVADFQGQVGVQDIFTFLRRQDPAATIDDAERVNRQLAAELNREPVARSKDLPLDVNGKVSLGNNWFLGKDWEVGALLGGSYATSWRQETAIATNFNFPAERTDTERETTQSVNVAGTLALGVKYLEDHEIATSSLWLRNTDDETAIRDFFNENREKSDGIGFRNYRFQFEARELLTHQIRGSHFLGAETRDRFPLLGTLVGWLPEATRISWYYSDSEAETDIPNQAEYTLFTVTDPQTGAVQSETVALSNQAANYRFTDLNDEVQDYGWAADLPVDLGRNSIVLSGGWAHNRKARRYEQVEFSLGPLDVADTSLLGEPIDRVFSDANILDPGNNFVFDQVGTNQESYIAATMTDSIFGIVDWTWDDTWRVALGARWEDYRQAAVPWNPLGFTADNPQIDQDEIVQDDGNGNYRSDIAFRDDDVYPSASLTYMGELWADTFQLRFGWSETAVRPDLREITGASYIDPITDDLTRGNPGVVPALVRNYDVRAEWFFGNGDNVTATLFYKDLVNPIEFFESAVSDTKTAREIVNAESAEIRGVEVEFLKELGFLGSFMDFFFLQGNATFQDTELVAGRNADAPTNNVRQLAGASDWMANLLIGFDSPDARHTATLVYNTFGERLYVAGRLGAPDSFEQPFQSLDLTWSWYPTDQMTMKFKAVNLLGDEIEIERQGITVFEEDPGTTLAVSLQYSFL
ncbi:MAG: TonB-dependent receptor, partial [Woeseiaceae bacterium]|nr:TonB-dependent receptor [Woeseiaceae bacterium]